MALSACAATLLLACSKEPPAPPAVDRVVRAPAEASVNNAANDAAFTVTLPQAGGPPGYVGSAACRSCHQDQYTSWHRSYHRTMTQVASDESVQADFNNVVLESGPTRFSLAKANGEYWVRMEPLNPPPSDGGPRPSLEQRLALVTGSHHMQVFWVPQGDGNLQLGFPFTWLIPEKRWVPRNSTFVRPPDLPHSAEVWNVVCSRCHTTGVLPRVNIAARTAHTQVAELGISCEACHGPGQRHAERQRASSGSEKTLVEGEIVHPRKLPAERSAQVCGFCHSMKWIDKSSEWRENGFEFRPGDDLEKSTPIIRPGAVDSNPGLKGYLAHHPDILRDFFWPDGMVRVSGRELNGLIQSPCYKGGKFSCISCHSMHESEPDDQLAAKARGNGACLQCHEKLKQPATLTAHTHHTEGSSGSECYNCHMPHTTYGILKAIRSHQVSSPNVREDLATGRPNACNLCHLDQSLAWSAEKLQKWYGQKPIDLPPEEKEISHILRLALSGDAGQRVLAAWHLSWPPALQCSSTNWIPAALAPLLDDPYAAVRCVAARGWPGQMPVPDYDFAVEPQSRNPVRDDLWDWLEARAPRVVAPNTQVLTTGANQIDRDRFKSLVQRRNDLPVRLRE